MGARETSYRTHHVKRMPGAEVPTRTVIGPGATGPITPPWLSLSKTTKPDKREDTKGAGMLKFLRFDVFTPQIFGHVPLFSGAAAN